MSPKSPRAPVTRSEQKAATQRQLLEAARRCFERQGYAGTAIGDIAREAGVAHGTFYVHFESREAVADVLLQGFNDNLSRALVPLLTADHGSLEATVREAAKLFLVALDDDRALVRFYAERAASGLPPDALATGINPPALAALIGETNITGIFVIRVSMDGNRQHISAVVENILRAIAAMIVNIQHSDGAFLRK